LFQVYHRKTQNKFILKIKPQITHFGPAENPRFLKRRKLINRELPIPEIYSIDLGQLEPGGVHANAHLNSFSFREILIPTHDIPQDIISSLFQFIPRALFLAIDHRKANDQDPKIEPD
jgi:hypothetical protein